MHDFKDLKNKSRTIFQDTFLPKFREHKILILATIIILLFALFYKLYHTYTLQHSFHVQPISISAATVIEKAITVPFKAIGNVAAYQAVSIKSQASGQIIKIGFQRGQTVKQDQLLFVIDPRPAEAQLQQLQANLAKDQAQLQNAQLNTARDKALIKKSFVSQATYDADQTAEAMQKAAVQADEAAIANAELQLEYSYIKAPVTGRTGDIYVDEGNIINAAQYTTLTTINQLQPIYVNFAVPQKYFSIVAQDRKTPIPVTVTSHKKTKKGQLSFVDNQINTVTGTVNLKAVFPNTDLQLWPGQYVEVNLPTATFDKALVVPASTVQQGPSGSYVFIIKQDSTVAYHAVAAGATVDNDTIILSGLKVGDRVVTAGQLQLVDGRLVKVVDEKKTSQSNPSSLAGEEPAPYLIRGARKGG